MTPALIIYLTGALIFASAVIANSEGPTQACGEFLWCLIWPAVIVITAVHLILKKIQL